MKKSNKSILLVTRNLPPLVGGMETLLLHCANTISKHYSLTVVGPRGCSAHLDESIKVFEVSSSLIGFLGLAPLSMLRAMIGTRFDLIFGGSGLMAPICWLFGKVFRSISLCYVHGLDVVTPNRIYQAFFVPCLRWLDLVLVNSGNTMRLCVEAGVQKKKITIIHPGCEIPASVDPASAREFLRGKYGIYGNFWLLFVGRIAPRKGLLAFMQNGFEALLSCRPDTVLVIAGDSPTESLSHRSAELHKVSQEVENNGWAERVVFLGKVDNETLSKCYAASDCLLFPLVPVTGDVEGFGMVAIEAAAHGTPTVAFAEGGVADAVAHGLSGYLVASGDYAGMVDTLERVESDELFSSTSRAHARKFGWDIFDKSLLDKLDDMISS